MIELHFHCLPGLDDGPASWDDAVALCLASRADGADTIVATPHVMRDDWLNEDAGARDDLVLRLNDRLNGGPSILAGCEYFFSSDAAELWENGSLGPLTGLNRTSYLLVEFPEAGIPRTVQAAFHELTLLGVTPVIAHPERNLELRSHPERLGQLIDLGAVAQITAGSVLGDFGRSALAACDTFFSRGLVHLIASDAHSVKRRPPRLSAARQRVRRKWGSDAESLLFEDNPRAVIAGEPIGWTATGEPRLHAIVS
jgi:protein-tyrosine phosphatase